MYRFIETIRVENGKIERFALHANRVWNTRKHFWGYAEPFTVDTVTSVVTPMSGIYKLRFTYDETHIYDLSYTPYHFQNILQLQPVIVNTIDYAYKYADRSAFAVLKEEVGEGCEPLIIRDGLVTDTSYTNIAFFDGCQWFTPSTPLLNGTRRQSLLASHQIREKEIRFHDIPQYTSIALFNAMMDLGDLILPISAVKNYAFGCKYCDR